VRDPEGRDGAVPDPYGALDVCARKRMCVCVCRGDDGASLQCRLLFALPAGSLLIELLAAVCVDFTAAMTPHHTQHTRAPPSCTSTPSSRPAPWSPATPSTSSSRASRWTKTGSSTTSTRRCARAMSRLASGSYAGFFCVSCNVGQALCSSRWSTSLRLRKL